MAKRRSNSRASKASRFFAKILALFIIVVATLYVFNIDTTNLLAKATTAIDSAVSTIGGASENAIKTISTKAGAAQTSTNQSKTQLTPEMARILPQKGKLSVVVLDVGQADCIFIQSPNGKTMLIDSGDFDAYNTINSFLTYAKVSKIDILVATHPHSDHIGSMKKVVENYEIGAVYMPKAEHTSKTYISLLQAISDKSLKINATTGGATKVLPFDNDLKINILSPISASYKSLNNYSIVLKITYGKNSILLTGDAEKLVESEMLKKIPAEMLSADVIKIGHHGSSTSSTADFLQAVNPKQAIVSVGTNNKYNHPNEKIMERLNELGIQVYQTRTDGSIGVFSNGENYNIIKANK